jgi:hypothetical protein
MLGLTVLGLASRRAPEAGVGRNISVDVKVRQGVLRIFGARTYHPRSYSALRRLR